MSEQPACAACGMSLPISVSNEKQETTLEATVEPRNFDEESSAAIPSDRNNGIEIRLVLTDCACRRTKLVLENESKISEAEKKSIAVDAIDGSNEIENYLKCVPLNVPWVSEGRKYDEFAMNVCQFWGKNWRQFTSVLPGLILLLTAGVHIVFTIHELDHFSGWNQLRSFLCTTDYYNFIEDSSNLTNYGSHDCAMSRHKSSEFDSPALDNSYNNMTEMSNRDDDRPGNGYATSFVIIIMWFVGATVGNVLGAALIRNLKKRSIYYLAATLQILAGTLFFLMRHELSNTQLPFVPISYKSMLVNQMTLGGGARLVSGVVSGLVSLTVTVHASDIASKRMRRVISYAIVMIIAFSAFFYSVVYRYWYLPHRSLGSDLISFDFNMIAHGLLVLLLTPVLTNEAVPYYLSRGKVAKAQRKFAKLNNERSGELSAETLDKFDKLQLMVREDKENGQNIFCGGNLKPLITVLSARLLHLILTNAATMIAVISAISTIPIPVIASNSAYLPELNGLRIIVGIVMLPLASCFGRQKFFFNSTLVMASMFGGAFLLAFLWKNWLTVNALLAAFVIASLGLDCYQQEQSVDAFTTTKKAWSLATIAVLEHITHAALAMTYMKFEFFVPSIKATCICLVALPIVLLAAVPDTRKLSLRETRNKFNKTMAGIFEGAATHKQFIQTHCYLCRSQSGCSQTESGYCFQTVGRSLYERNPFYFILSR